METHIIGEIVGRCPGPGLREFASELAAKLYHQLYPFNRSRPDTASCLSRIMARQKITVKKTASQPRDDGLKGGPNTKVAQPAPSHESDANGFDEPQDDDEEEDSGVDDEGLEKLMNALGEDGLSEFDLAQLRMLSGAAAGEEEDSSDGEEDGADAEPQEEAEEADEGIALDDEDVDSVDQDAIPRRKVQVDNKVCHFPLFTCQLILW